MVEVKLKFRIVFCGNFVAIITSLKLLHHVTHHLPVWVFLILFTLILHPIQLICDEVLSLIIERRLVLVDTTEEVEEGSMNLLEGDSTFTETGSIELVWIFVAGIGLHD